MQENGPSVCELCGGALRRVLFPSGIIFKGSGFYRNDSRASSSSDKGGSETSAGTGKSDGTGAETKSVPATADGGTTGSTAAPKDSSST